MYSIAIVYLSLCLLFQCRLALAACSVHCARSAPCIALAATRLKSSRRPNPGRRPFSTCKYSNIFAKMPKIPEKTTPRAPAAHARGPGVGPHHPTRPTPIPLSGQPQTGGAGTGHHWRRSPWCVAQVWGVHGAGPQGAWRRCGKRGDTCATRERESPFCGAGPNPKTSPAPKSSVTGAKRGHHLHQPST